MEEDLWKQAFLVGNEWDQLEKVSQYNWNFSNLNDAFEVGGVLNGKKAFLFGFIEPQLVPFNNDLKVICIPVVVAIVSPFSPSDKMAIQNQMETEEEIVPMEKMKINWVPYIPLENGDIQVDGSQIFILRGPQREAALEFKYCVPYFYNPLKQDDLEQSTEVQIRYPAEPKPVFCEFDWNFDEIEEFTDYLINDEALCEDQKDDFQEFVKEKVQEKKRANKEAREARKKAVEEMSEETRQGFESMEFYKFYPVKTLDTPDISNVNEVYINRYYGRAHEVF